MTPQTKPIMSPDAALFLPAPYFPAEPPGPKIYFFKNRQFVAWDVIEERLCDDYPKDTQVGWPGLLEAFPGVSLRAALHVPSWGRTVFFFFEGQAELVAWDLDQKAVLPQRIPIDDVLPGAFSGADFTPVYSERADRTGVIYGFKGRDLLRWTAGTSWPAQADSGYPHKIEDDWKEGLVLAPRTGVYLEWTNRSLAHSNRKIYYFMGDLYLRWDVPSNTRNYRLDIAAGWKGWPRFE